MANPETMNTLLILLARIADAVERIAQAFEDQNARDARYETSDARQEGLDKRLTRG